MWAAHPDAPTLRDLLLAAGIDLDGPRIQLAS